MRNSATSRSRPASSTASNPPSGDGQTDISLFQPAVTALYAGNTVNGDLLAGKAWIRTQAPRGKVGLYGNCMGGGIVLQALAGNTDYDAASVLYGYVRADRKTTEPPPAGAFDWAPKVNAAVIGFYGGARRQHRDPPTCKPRTRRSPDRTT